MVGAGVGPQTCDVLLLKQLPEALPAHAGCFLVLAVGQFILQVRPGPLGFLVVSRLGALALAPAGVRVDPLEHEGFAVLEPLHPDRDALFWHSYLPCVQCHGHS
jgi:hypothetical protein